MSRPLAIWVQGGGKECFGPRCPVYDRCLTHLKAAPYSNVYRSRLRQLQQVHPDLLRVHEKNENATLTCTRDGCPIAQGKIATPVIKVQHLKPDNSGHSDNSSNPPWRY